MKERKVSFRLALTKYGRTALAMQREAARADQCEAKIKTAEVISWREAQGDFDDGCTNLAKMVVNGHKVCAKHASAMLLEAALKAQR